MKLDSNIFSKAPTFNETGLDSPITEFVLAITALKDDKYYASGSAIIIGSNLAITAHHVIDDFFREFEGNYLDVPRDSEVAGTFHLQVFQILNNGKSGLIWNVTKIWSCKFTDIAVLRITPITKEALDYKWRIPKIDLIPPKVGDRISCFGYAKPKIKNKGNIIEWFVDSRTSIGEVREVYTQKRDNCKLSFPCFQTNARFDAGMSGGPVFNDKGSLCGIVCSTLQPLKDGEEHASFVTSLWPLMAIEIDINREGYPKDIKYPILELAKTGIIPAEGWEQITLFTDEDGNIVKIRLNPA